MFNVKIFTQKNDVITEENQAILLFDASKKNWEIWRRREKIGLIELNT